MRSGSDSRATPASDETRLAERMARGEAGAEDEFAARFQRRVFALLCGRLRDPDAARDLAQDTLLTCLRALRGRALRDPDKLEGFVFGTARHHARNYLRRLARRGTTEPLNERSAWFAPADQVETTEQYEALQEAVTRLCPIDRRILFLAEVEGRSSACIAAELGLSPAAVRQRKTRAEKRVVAIARELLDLTFRSTD
jgi:RNA polymerase sigma factor (sigma-70 family)